MKVQTKSREVEIDIIDVIADESLQVEIQKQIGWEHRYVLYVHEKGQTIIRIGNLTEDQIKVHGLTAWNRTGI